MANKSMKNSPIVAAIIIGIAIIIAAVLIISTFQAEFKAILLGLNDDSDNQGGNNALEYSYPDELDLDKIGLKVHFIDVGQGDAIFIEFNDDKTMLIDAGGENNASDTKFFNYLNDLEVETINYMILTHSDQDHIRNTMEVIDEYEVESIYINNDSKDTKIARDVRAKVAEYETDGGTVYWFDADGDTYNIDGDDYSVEIYAPGHSWMPNISANDTSPYVIVEYESRRILFCGDAEKEAEHKFISEYKGNKNFDIIKSGHHGSSTSSSPEFLSFFTFQYAVIMCNALGGNNYHHPHAETMNRYFNLGIVTYRTDRHGNIVAMFDSDGDFAFKTDNYVPVENNLFGAPDLMVPQI